LEYQQQDDRVQKEAGSGAQSSVFALLVRCFFILSSIL
jgi:hypothetical protein